jgi:cytidylate kinase
MYRAVTLAVLDAGIDPANERQVIGVAKSAEITIQSADQDDGRQYTVLLAGKDVTWELRSERVDQNVSVVAAYPAVRDEMVERQRTIGKKGRVVMVGRDIGTVVLPDAPLKLYVTASAEERARRRVADKADQGLTLSFDDVLADIKLRDKQDSEREHSPLKPAADAILIDTTDHDPDQVVSHILTLPN